jgi:UDP-N-acetyl-D-mannosaminuronic acid dehydrogenase
MQVPPDFADRQVAIIGLGYVGLTLAVCMAEVGFRVYGVEKSAHVRACLAAGHAHFREATLDQRLKRQLDSERITVYADVSQIPRGATVYIITVGTPLQPDCNKVSLSAIEEVADGVAARLSAGDLVVLRSTVRVGVCRNVVKPRLDRFGLAYALAFCPERTLEGKALSELRSLPQVIGGINEEATLRASVLFSFLTPTVVRVSSIETAEMIKLVNNTQRDLMFAFANEVAETCDALGVSAIEVIRAGNIGYPRASMSKPGPVGGPCLGKDPYILAESVEIDSCSPKLALLGRQINETLPERIVDHLTQRLSDTAPLAQNPKISLLGLAFKGRPETSDLRGTPAIPLIAALRKTFPLAQIWGHDPAVPPEDIAALGIEVAAHAGQAFADATIVIFQNNNPSFEQLPLADLSETMAPNAIIYDCWTQFEPSQIGLRPDVRYGGLGSCLLFDQARDDWNGAGARPELSAPPSTLDGRRNNLGRGAGMALD